MRFTPVRFTLILAAVFTLAEAASLQSLAAANQSDSHTQMDHRGDQVMGFSAARTTHHFRLFENGGSIEVTANDPNDSESREQIRMHLSHIASMFGEGNFRAPMLVHDTNPPGTATLTKLRSEIQYEYGETATGARIRIKTENPQALDAVHAFLLFQIIEHRTGDPANIQFSD